MTFLDTVDAYPITLEPATAGRTEEVLGRWLQAKGRDRFVVAIQCRIRVGTGPNDARAACEAAWWTLPRRHEPR